MTRPTAATVPLQAAVAGPEVRLLDARSEGFDEEQLRAWARRQTEAARAAHVSRSYRHPYALVAWHDQPLGVDIERIEPCDEAFADYICTPEERAALAGPDDLDVRLTTLWSSKEALSKALGDALRYEPSRLGSPLAWPGGRSGPWRAAELAAPAGHVAWLCWRTAAVH